MWILRGLRDMLSCMNLALLLENYDKIAFAGIPRAGKSTAMAEAMLIDPDRHFLATDAFMKEPWADAPLLVIAALEGRDRYLVEGVNVGRALRKGLAPDVVIWFHKAHVDLTPGQAVMAKGCRTIFTSWLAMDTKVEVLGWPMAG